MLLLLAEINPLFNPSHLRATTDRAGLTTDGAGSHVRADAPEYGPAGCSRRACAERTTGRTKSSTARSRDAQASQKKHSPRDNHVTLKTLIGIVSYGHDYTVQEHSAARRRFMEQIFPNGKI